MNSLPENLHHDATGRKGSWHMDGYPLPRNGSFEFPNVGPAGHPTTPTMPAPSHLVQTQSPYLMMPGPSIPGFVPVAMGQYPLGMPLSMPFTVQMPMSMPVQLPLVGASGVGQDSLSTVPDFSAGSSKPGVQDVAQAAGADVASTERVEVGEETKTKIVSQVEFYFSDQNLPTDNFLMKHVKINSEGFVPIKLVAGFRRIKLICTDLSVITAALRTSTVLVVSKDGARVRRKEALPEIDLHDVQLRTVIAENLPEHPTIETMESLFSRAGKVCMVRICRPDSVNGTNETARLTKEDMVVSNKLHALVEYESVEAARNACVELTDNSNWRAGLHVRPLLRGDSRIQHRQQHATGHPPHHAHQQQHPIDRRRSGEQDVVAKPRTPPRSPATSPPRSRRSSQRKAHNEHAASHRLSESPPTSSVGTPPARSPATRSPAGSPRSRRPSVEGKKGQADLSVNWRHHEGEPEKPRTPLRSPEDSPIGSPMPMNNSGERRSTDARRSSEDSCRHEDADGHKVPDRARKPDRRKSRRRRSGGAHPAPAGGEVELHDSSEGDHHCQQPGQAASTNPGGRKGRRCSTEQQPQAGKGTPTGTRHSRRSSAPGEKGGNTSSSDGEIFTLDGVGTKRAQSADIDRTCREADKPKAEGGKQKNKRRNKSHTQGAEATQSSPLLKQLGHSPSPPHEIGVFGHGGHGHGPNQYGKGRGGMSIGEAPGSSPPLRGHPVGPLGPDGSRGFTMGRGRKLSLPLV